MKDYLSRFRAYWLISLAVIFFGVGIGYTADSTVQFGHLRKLFKDIGSGYHAEAVYVYNSPTVTVSGLPAAAALADNAANPTVPAVGAFGMVWDGATWDRLPGTAADGLTVNLGANNDVILGVENLTYTHSNVSVDNASEALVASNASRKSLIISNDSDTKVYINLAGGTASATAGIPLAAGSSLVLSAGEKFFTTSAMTVITSSGTTKSVNVAEGV